MIKVILQKEWKDLLRDGRVKWFCIVLLLLLATSVITTYRYAARLKADHEAGMQFDRNTWEHQRPKNPHSAAHYGFYLFKPVHPLSIFEPGVDRFTGSTLFLEAHQRNNEQFSAITEESDLARLGFLSPSFILQFLLPLLIIVAGFNSITKEREGANLLLLTAQGVSFKQIAWGKWLAVYSLGVALLLAIFIVNVITLFFQHASLYVYTAAVGLLLLYLVYYAIITNIVFFISSKAKQSGRALLYCVLFWMTACLVAPRIVSNIAQRNSPLLTNEEVIAQVKALNDKYHDNVHDRTSGVYERMVDSLLKHYKVDSISQLPVNVSGVRLDKGEQTDTRNYTVVDSMQMQRLHRQQNILTAGSLFSPLIPSQQMSMALANTDIFSHHHFTDAGEQYRRTFVNIMNRYIAYESGIQEAVTSFKATDSLWKRVPVFSYQPPQFSLFRLYRFSLLALLLWLFVTAWAFNKSIHLNKSVKA